MRPAMLLAVAALAVQGAGRREPSPPPLLSQAGLYGPSVLAYSPQYPLWSDGASKARWFSLPKGAAIDVRDPDAWKFPVGTKFWKEFSFRGRKVETRLLWHAASGTWVYAAYAWRVDQSEADLVGKDGLQAAAEIAPGIFHAIPSLQDCKACHETPEPAVLGFNALQLSTDRDPGAIHGEPLRPGMATLATLVERRLIQPPRREFIDRPPRIRTGNPRTRAALGYLTSNCGNCHQPENRLPRVTLALRHPLGTPDEASEPALRSAVRQPVHGAPGAVAIAPGDPDASLALARMASRDPLTRMPPVGTVLVDQEAVDRLRAWIAQDLGGGPR